MIHQTVSTFSTISTVLIVAKNRFNRSSDPRSYFTFIHVSRNKF
ncbi:unnamed protein product [Oikopleura dioica]|uniref:Uncharacterized protein n=1 Tax=Oikopleura dioica TaxID=34765 RepID=E4XKB3_OIKDI|nr:unnamed protein product [Oikopleura dioica]